MAFKTYSFFLFKTDGISLYGSGCPETPSLDPFGLELGDSPVSASPVYNSRVGLTGP